jgi:hypothetical protein
MLNPLDVVRRHVITALGRRDLGGRQAGRDRQFL